MKKKRRLEILGAVMILLGMNLMCLYELHRYRSNIFDLTAQDQHAYLKLMRSHVNQAEALDQAIMKVFEEEFHTNSRYFGFLVKNEELLYFRDDNSLKNAQDLMSQTTDVQVNQGNGYDMITLAGGANYLLTAQTIRQGEDTYTIGILQEETYILERTQFISYARHTILFQVLATLALLVLVLQLSRITQRQANEIAEWKLTEQENRTLIERLLQDIKIARKSHIEDTVFGFLSKRQFARLLTKLNDEQQHKCQLIRIYVLKDDPAIRIQLAAILQRMDILKCVSCEWHVKEFCVLALHVDALQMEQILRYIITSYQRDFGGNLDDLKLVTQAVRRE